VGALRFLLLPLRISTVATQRLCTATRALPQARQFCLGGESELEVVAVLTVKANLLAFGHLNAFFILETLGS